MLYSVFYLSKAVLCYLLPLFRTQLCQTCTCLLLFLRTSWQRISFPRWTAQTGKHKRFDKTSTKSFFFFKLLSLFEDLFERLFCCYSVRWPVSATVVCPAWAACWTEGSGLAELRAGPIRFTAYWPLPMACWLSSTKVQKQVCCFLCEQWWHLAVCLSPCQLTNNENKKFFIW